MEYTINHIRPSTPNGSPMYEVVNDKGERANVPHKTRAEAEKHCELLNAFFGEVK